MRILVLDQCSGSKSYPEGSPMFSLDDLEEHSREGLLEEGGVAAKKARNLYDGRQQRRIDGAVDSLRDAGHHVDRYFVSAGFGLVEETELLPPYDVTFQDFSDDEIRERADDLELSREVSKLLSSEPAYDVAFLALGGDYCTAIGVPDVLEDFSGDTAVVFNNSEAASARSRVLSLPARTKDARDRGVIVVELKGKYLQNFARTIRQGEPVLEDAKLRDACLNGPAEQSDFREHG